MQTLVLLILLGSVFGNLEEEIYTKINEKNYTSLSRKRRYLVFPDGSSFQVVFDLTYPSVGGGNAFVFGNTAALAWELPSTPIFLDKKKWQKEENTTEEKKPETEEHPVEVVPESNFWNPPLSWHGDLEKPYGWNTKTIWSEIDRSPVKSYYNPFDSYVQGQNQGYTELDKSGHPVYHGYGGQLRRKDGLNRFWTRRNLQNNRYQLRNRHGDTFSKTVFHHIHRRSRRELYTKLEKFLTALTKDGKSCILRTICEVAKVSKNSNEKGTLVAEIFKAIFKVKPHDDYPDEDHYDTAANPNHDCAEMYPTCEGHVLSKIFNNK